MFLTHVIYSWLQFCPHDCLFQDTCWRRISYLESGIPTAKRKWDCCRKHFRLPLGDGISLTLLPHVVVQPLSHVWLFLTLWTAARQASLSFTFYRSLLKLVSIESMMPIHYLILCCPLLLPSVFPSIRVFSPELVLCISWPKLASALASVLPMNIQGWFPLGLAGLISLQSKELSRVLFSTSVWKHQVFDAQPPLWSNSHIFTWFLEKP